MNKWELKAYTAQKQKQKQNETRTNIEQEILTGKLKTKETLQWIFMWKEIQIYETHK